MRTFSLLFVSFFLAVTSFGQSSKKENSQKFSIEFQYGSDLTTIKRIISGYKPYQPFSKYVKTAFEAYRLTYTSDLNGEEVTLSGSILIPKKYSNKNKPLLVFCHGTNFSQNVASNRKSPMHIESLPAMNNYITFLPDYLGYGISSKRMPTYMDKKITVRHINDFIRYGIKALNKLKVEHSDSVNIIGFSQGGHAALAIGESYAKKIPEEFTLKNVVSIGGPTYLAKTLDHILTLDTFTHSGYLTYVFGSYNYYHWNKKATTFFNQPYDRLIRDFQNRNLSLKALSDSTPDNIKNLVSKNFIKTFSVKKTQKFRRNFIENSIKPYKSSVPIYIIHGKKDEDIPFFITEEFYHDIKKLNKPGYIKFIPIDNVNHNTSGLMGMGMALDYFNNL